MSENQLTLFDTHAHIYSPEFPKEEQMAVVERARKASVGGMILIATNSMALHEGELLQQKLGPDWILKLAASTTPHEAISGADPFFDEVKEKAKAGLLVGIGETGLDKHYHGGTISLQMRYLEKYAELAMETNLPLIIHSREAYDDLYAFLRGCGPALKGVIHCFTGTTEEALQYCTLGFYISISGIVTFNKALKLQEAVCELPLEHLLIETDSPYLAPEPHRGKKNEPSYLVHVAEKIARLRNISLEEVSGAATENAKRLFRIEGL